MKTKLITAAIAAATVTGVGRPSADAGSDKINVVTTIATYGYLARVVGGDRVRVVALVAPDQDPHFVQPKLSLVEKLARADLFVDTGLDLELWVPALQDSAGNKRIMSGGEGYVSASHGVALRDKVAFADRKEGDVHVYGNPHVYVSPLAQKQIARNIATGLKRIDPAGAQVYERNYAGFAKRLDSALFGDELVRLLGSRKLEKLAETGKLIPFLEKKSYKGKPLLDYLGGWMRKALPLRGKKVVAYHKNWAYFSTLFGFEVVEFVEPKPGIPPSPRHISKVVGTIERNHIQILLAATYYDMSKLRAIARRTGLDPVVVGIAVDGRDPRADVFSVTDTILDRMLAAVK